MNLFDCEKGYVPDNGQNDVEDGSVENFDFDWNEPDDTTEDNTDGATANTTQPVSPTR